MAYTDGSAYNNGTADAGAGAGVWYGKGDERNVAIHLPGPHQTNNAAEIRAVLKQVLAAAQDKTMITNSELWKVTATILQQHGAPIYFRWTKEHSGDPGNKGVDSLAGKGAELSIEDATQADTEIDHKFDVTGDTPAWCTPLKITYKSSL